MTTQGVEIYKHERTFDMSVAFPYLKGKPQAIQTIHGAIHCDHVDFRSLRILAANHIKGFQTFEVWNKGTQDGFIETSFDRSTSRWLVTRHDGRGIEVARPLYCRRDELAEMICHQASWDTNNQPPLTENWHFDPYLMIDETSNRPRNLATINHQM